MTDLEKIQNILNKKHPMDGMLGKTLYHSDKQEIFKTIIAMDKRISELIQENYWLKQSIEAENDRLDRNNRLEMQNEVLRAKERHYIHDMNEMLKVNERLASDLAKANAIIETYQRTE